MSTTPTDDQILQVKQNLSAMQKFNDYAYLHGNPLIANCYALLSEDQGDRGLAVVDNMMCSMFFAMGAVEGAGPVGAFAANTMCGILVAWTNGGVAPPDMGATFASLISRFNAASVDLDNQLAIYHDAIEANWDTVFTYNGQSSTLGDLANGVFPLETDPDFFLLMDPCLWALDQYVWKMILTNGTYTVAEWVPPTSMPADFNFASWEGSFFGVNPSYWATCVYHPDSGSCGDSSCNYLTEFNISTGASQYHDGHIPDNACNYLFADRAPGQTYAECTRGLFPRADVFTTWSLVVKQIYIYYGSAPAPGWEYPLIGDYLQAKKEGKPVLSNLFAEIGADGIKARILEAVKQDPSLRMSLQRRPRETMASILGVAVPPSVDFSFISEGPGKWALVLPWS